MVWPIAISSSRRSSPSAAADHQVRSPGQFLVGRYVDVLQALTLAGGLTPFADGSKIKILRRRGGEEQVIPFNYKQVERGNNLEQNIILQADDTVIVP